jgi:signal transduction histidine kinase
MRWLGACLAGMVVFGTLAPAVAVEPKRVMLLHSFGRDFKPWSEYAQAIRAELGRQSPFALDITDQSLVTARSSDEDPERPFVDYLRALYVSQPPDVIVSIGAPAAAFVQRHRPQLFNTTPMVFTAVEQRRVQYSALSRDDVVVPVRIDYLAAFQNILQVLPETRNVAVVVGTSPIEKFWREEIAKEISPLADRIALTWYDTLSFEGILKHAAALPPHSAIFWELMIVDAAGVVHEGSAALSRLHAVAKAPIFSYDESFFGHGIVGGPLLSVLEGSSRTAEVAIRILGGERAGDIKTAPIAFAAPQFDWREMQRWGISEARLPRQSAFQFRDPTLWERYRLLLVAVFLTLLVQTAMITWLLVERYRRHRAESESHRRSLEVIHLNRAAEAGALSASFAHDLGQPLAAIALSSQLAENLLDAASPQSAKLKQAVANIRRANDYAMKVNKQFGQLLKRKTDQEVEECDINAIVDDAAHILRAEAKSRHIDLVIEGAPGPLLVRADPVHLLQVVFNLATNAMDAMADMPPGARKLRIQTALDGSSSVRVTVADSGPGIPRDKIKEVFSSFYTTKKHGTGLGLSIAKTIVETYGGSIWAENASGGGAMVCFALPLQRPVSSMRRVVDGQLRALRPLLSTRTGKGASDPPPAASQPGVPSH